MHIHRRLFQMVSTVVIVTILFSGFQFAPVSAQENADHKPALLGGIWYVATTGNDANSCLSANSPCKTINAAIGKAAAGDTIRVAVGTYYDLGPEVVLVDKSITLSGGWNTAFTTQSGRSTVDGRDHRRGVTVTAGDVRIDRFTIQHGRERFGGGLYNTIGPLTLTNSIITGNAGEWMGGGIFNYYMSTLIVRDTTISGNTAGTVGTSGGGGGGGIMNYGGTLTLENSTVSGNRILGWYQGCGIHNVGVATIVNSTISGNTGGNSPGGIVVGGEGIYNSYGYLLLNNSTLAFNGLWGFTNQGGVVSLSNTILAGNGSGRDCYNYYADSGWVQSQRYNLIGNGYGCRLNTTPEDLIGSNEHPIDPLLGPLQDNGGPTFTHALGPGSPAIDAGEPYFLGRGEFFCPIIDQRGVTRPQGEHCDIGAYEVKASIEISIAGNTTKTYVLASGASKRVSFAGINTGPVKITDNNSNTPLVAAERVIYRVGDVNTSFSEMMALPDSQLDTTYWLPWYNSKDLNTQLRIANVSGMDANVQVIIGGQDMGSFILTAGASARKSYASIDKGPVQIVSDQNVIVSERVIYTVNGVNTSFSEMMALPNSQLDPVYWLPWYNSKSLDTQLRIANVSDTEATVNISIGGSPVPGSPFSLAVGASKRLSFSAIDKGPVKIESAAPIVASERVIYKLNGVGVSFSEMMALPNSQVDPVFWLPWYNSKSLNTQLRISNVSSSTATVHVRIGGMDMIGSPFSIRAGGSRRLSFPNIDKGPVQIYSNVDIIAAERVIYAVNGLPTSFSEMMGLPDSQLDTLYWLPWYNNKDLDTQLRFGVP